MMIRKIFALPEEVVTALAMESKTWPGGDDRGREASIVRDALEKRYRMTSGGHIPLTPGEVDLIEGLRRLWRADPKTSEALFLLAASCERDVSACDVVRGVAGLLAQLLFAPMLAGGRPDTAPPGASTSGSGTQYPSSEDRTSVTSTDDRRSEKMTQRRRARHS